MYLCIKVVVNLSITQQDIDNLVEFYPWAMEETAQKVAQLIQADAADSAALAVAMTQGKISVESLKGSLSETLKKVSAERRSLNQSVQNYGQELNRSFRLASGAKSVKDIMNSDIKFDSLERATEELQRGLGSAGIKGKLGAAAGMLTKVASRGNLALAGFAVAVRAVYKQAEFFNAIIDRGLQTDGLFTGAVRLEQQIRLLTGDTLETFFKATDGFGTTFAQFGDNTMEGYQTFAKFFTEMEKYNVEGTGRDFGRSIPEFITALAQEAQILYTLNQIEGLGITEKRAVLRSYMNVNEIALFMAGEFGLQRDELLAARMERMQSVDFIAGYANTAEHHISKYGADVHQNSIATVDSILMGLQAAGIDESMISEFEGALNRARYDFAKDETVINNLTPEFVQKLNELGFTNVLPLLDKALVGLDTDPVSALKELGGLLKTVHDRRDLMLTGTDDNSQQQRDLAISFLNIPDNILDAMMNMTPEMLAEYRRKSDEADSTQDFVDATKQFKGAFMAPMSAMRILTNLFAEVAGYVATLLNGDTMNTAERIQKLSKPEGFDEAVNQISGNNSVTSDVTVRTTKEVKDPVTGETIGTTTTVETREVQGSVVTDTEGNVVGVDIEGINDQIKYPEFNGILETDFDKIQQALVKSAQGGIINIDGYTPIVEDGKIVRFESAGEGVAGVYQFTPIRDESGLIRDVVARDANGNVVRTQLLKRNAGSKVSVQKNTVTVNEFNLAELQKKHSVLANKIMARQREIYDREVESFIENNPGTRGMADTDLAQARTNARLQTYVEFADRINAEFARDVIVVETGEVTSGNQRSIEQLESSNNQLFTGISGSELRQYVGMDIQEGDTDAVALTGLEVIEDTYTGAINDSVNFSATVTTALKELVYFETNRELPEVVRTRVMTSGGFKLLTLSEIQQAVQDGSVSVLDSQSAIQDVQEKIKLLSVGDVDRTIVELRNGQELMLNRGQIIEKREQGQINRRNADTAIAQISRQQSASRQQTRFIYEMQAFTAENLSRALPEGSSKVIDDMVSSLEQAILKTEEYLHTSQTSSDNRASRTDIETDLQKDLERYRNTLEQFKAVQSQSQSSVQGGVLNWDYIAANDENFDDLLMEYRNLDEELRLHYEKQKDGSPIMGNYYRGIINDITSERDEVLEGIMQRLQELNLDITGKRLQGMNE